MIAFAFATDFCLLLMLVPSESLSSAMVAAIVRAS